MLVTVVTPTYNRAASVCAAVDSALAQTHADIELIVVDDGSTDDTAARLAAYDDPRLVCLAQENRGQSAARNRAIAQARGELVAFLDSDDRWPTTKLEEQVAIMVTQPQVDVLFGDRVDVRDDGQVQHRLGLREYPVNMLIELLFSNVVNFNSSMVRAHVLRSHPFDESLRTGEDYDLWLRIAQDALFLYQPRTWLFYSVADGRLSQHYEDVFENNRVSMQRLMQGPSARVPTGVQRSIWCRFYSRYGRHHAAAGKRMAAARCFSQAIAYAPLSTIGWRAMVALLVGRI
ncbi:MAG: glycosyltransferase [Pseudomonadota bacterium]